MKLARIYYSVLLLPVIFCISCSTTGGVKENNTEKEIDAIAIQVSDYLIDKLPVNTRVSLMNLSRSELDASNLIGSRVSSGLVDSGKLVVLMRDDIESLNIEQNFQLSGVVSEKTTVSIGKFLGAESIITYSIAEQGGVSRLVVKAVDVETAQLKADRSFELTFLSKGNFSMDSLPPIEKFKTDKPFSNWMPFIQNIPDDEIVGIGFALSNFDAIGTARARSIKELARQVITIGSETYELELSHDENSQFFQEIEQLVSRNARILKRAQTSDGGFWCLSAMRLDSSIEAEAKKILVK